MSSRISFVRPACALLLPVVVVGSLSGCNSPAGPAPFPAITSTFETGDDGWTVIGDAEGPVWSANGEGPFGPAGGGNAGGYIYAVDRAEGDTWFWVAPAKFHGNVSGAYGYLLKFDLVQDQITNKSNNDDVVLSGGGITLRHNLDNDPGTAWTTYSIELVERRWRNVETGSRATRDELETVLRSLGELRIRGEFFRGPDTGGLRNVVFGAAR